MAKQKKTGGGVLKGKEYQMHNPRPLGTQAENQEKIFYYSKFHLYFLDQLMQNRSRIKAEI